MTGISMEPKWGRSHQNLDGITSIGVDELELSELIDGRKLEGFTPDYDPRRKAFTLFPKDDRGNVERVIVFNDAIRNIWFDE